MELSPSITTFPASLDACEEREDDEWRPVPIKFMGLQTRVGDGQESGLELRCFARQWGQESWMGVCKTVIPKPQPLWLGRFHSQFSYLSEAWSRPEPHPAARGPLVWEGQQQPGRALT